LTEVPLAGPRSLEIARDGKWYLALREGNGIFLLDPAKRAVRRIAGTGENGYSGDGGPAIAARFGSLGPGGLTGPKGLCVSDDGRTMFVADCENQPLVGREPIDRVHVICRHFALLYTALLRSQGVPARVRCGFANYFDPSKWYDHWIVERWDGTRWARDDPQVDDLQASAVHVDFDVHDQPAGRFLSGAEAWSTIRAGEADAGTFGIFDMWGLPFVAGNVVSDIACLNKVELLPWDSWGNWPDPYGSVPDDDVVVIDALSALVNTGDFEALRDRYLADDRLRVPPDIVSFQDGTPVEVHLNL
jgi:hypothetical protein